MVKRKDFLPFMYFSLFIHAPEKRDKLKLLVLKVEVEADKLKLSVQKMGQWQFCNSYQQQGCLHKNEQLQDIEGWRLPINRSFLSTKKAWILQQSQSLHTSEKFINQSQYQKYSYSTQSYFRIIFLRVSQTTIFHSLSSLKVVIRLKHQISFWLYILKPVKSLVIV